MSLGQLKETIVAGRAGSKTSALVVPFIGIHRWRKKLLLIVSVSFDRWFIFGSRDRQGKNGTTRHADIGHSMLLCRYFFYLSTCMRKKKNQQHQEKELNNEQQRPDKTKTNNRQNQMKRTNQRHTQHKNITFFFFGLLLLFCSCRFYFILSKWCTVDVVVSCVVVFFSLTIFFFSSSVLSTAPTECAYTTIVYYTKTRSLCLWHIGLCVSWVSERAGNTSMALHGHDKANEFERQRERVMWLLRRRPQRRRRPWRRWQRRLEWISRDLIINNENASKSFLHVFKFNIFILRFGWNRLDLVAVCIVHHATTTSMTTLMTITIRQKEERKKMEKTERKTSSNRSQQSNDEHTAHSAHWFRDYISMCHIIRT